MKFNINEISTYDFETQELLNNCEIKLDGQNMIGLGIVAFDTEVGWVEVLERDDKNEIVFEDGEPLTKQYFGLVEVVDSRKPKEKIDFDIEKGLDWDSKITPEDVVWYTVPDDRVKSIKLNFDALSLKFSTKEIFEAIGVPPKSWNPIPGAQEQLITSKEEARKISSRNLFKTFIVSTPENYKQSHYDKWSVANSKMELIGGVIQSKSENIPKRTEVEKFVFNLLDHAHDCGFESLYDIGADALCYGIRTSFEDRGFEKTEIFDAIVSWQKEYCLKNRVKKFDNFLVWLRNRGDDGKSCT